MQKTALVALLLTLAGGPALALDATSNARAATAGLSAGTTALDQAPGGISQLTERVTEVEKRVDQLGVADASTAPTAAELKRAEREQERHEEFLRQVWSAP